MTTARMRADGRVQAVVEGRVAFHTGKKLADNPYNDDSVETHCWINGFEDAKAEFRDTEPQTVPLSDESRKKLHDRWFKKGVAAFKVGSPLRVTDSIPKSAQTQAFNASVWIPNSIQTNAFNEGWLKAKSDAAKAEASKDQP